MSWTATGYALTTGADAAAAAYNRGVGWTCSGCGPARCTPWPPPIALDPTFALGHAALALLGHELCAPVDIDARLRDAALHAGRATERERSHVHAVVAPRRGDSAAAGRPPARPTPATRCCSRPRCRRSRSPASPRSREEAWAIVERARPAYGDDWWFTGLLAFMRQEQGRFDEAMELSCRSLAVEPGAGHSAHARAHAHYETGDHAAGLAWMDGWVTGDGAATDSLSHFSWHAALHELSLGDLDAVRRRYDAQLRPSTAWAAAALVDTGSLLLRWALTPGAADVPGIEEVAARRRTRRCSSGRPTPFLAMHAAVALLRARRRAPGCDRWPPGPAWHQHPTQREVVAPWPGRCAGWPRATAPARRRRWPRLGRSSGGSGGSDAQREVVEETRISALLRAGPVRRGAPVLLDRRLDRRHCRATSRWRESRVQPGSAGQA